MSTLKELSGMYKSNVILTIQQECFTELWVLEILKRVRKNTHINSTCRLENMLCFLYQNEMAGLQCIIAFRTRKIVSRLR